MPTENRITRTKRREIKNRTKRREINCRIQKDQVMILQKMNL